MYVCVLVVLFPLNKKNHVLCCVVGCGGPFSSRDPGKLCRRNRSNLIEGRRQLRLFMVVGNPTDAELIKACARAEI